jgi:hypothetical protein
LLTTRQENNYRNRLFLIQDQYLVIFKIHLNECKPEALRQFYLTAPFMIINIANIAAVDFDSISVSDYSWERISLMMVDDNQNNNEADWLHGRLMNCSANYRHVYVILFICFTKMILFILVMNKNNYMNNKPLVVLLEKSNGVIV